VFFVVLFYNGKAMVLKLLFFPHEENNYKPKVLHLSSLSWLILFIIFFQLFITVFHRVRPGVLGFASNINPQIIVELTNKQRNQHGVSSVFLNERLNEAARQKAADMFNKNYWAHYAPDGTTPWSFFKNNNYNYIYAGENLARDFNDSDAVVKAWMASPTHKENILNPKYQDIGVAVVNGILNGEETTLVVQMFGAPASQEPVISSQAASSQEGRALAAQFRNLSLTESLVSEKKPLISSLHLTKIIDLSLLLLLILILSLDTALIFHNRIVRRSGKSFIHLSFLTLILIILLLARQGQIL
jgi:hypothetical protein